MEVTEWFSASVALLAFGFGIYQYLARRRAEDLQAIIEGSKEAAGATALRVRNNRQNKYTARSALLRRRYSRKRRDDIQALCVAAVFIRSGRTRSLVYDALREQQLIHPDLIQTTVDALTQIVARNAGYTDLSPALRRLLRLRAALALDGDTRTRVDAIERFVRLKPSATTPCGCGDRAHSWRELRSAFRDVQSMFLICQWANWDDLSSGSATSAVIALSQHRGPSGSLSRIGKLVVDEKYSRKGTPGPGLERIARQMASLVRSNSAYREATHLAAVPGRRHSYSEALGAELQRLTGLPFIAIRRVDASKELRVTDDLTDAGSVILVDDVYRTGATYQAAAGSLIRAGAIKVVGLTATCTLSALDSKCHGGCDESDLIGGAS